MCVRVQIKKKGVYRENLEALLLLLLLLLRLLPLPARVPYTKPLLPPHSKGGGKSARSNTRSTRVSPFFSHPPPFFGLLAGRESSTLPFLFFRLPLFASFKPRAQARWVDSQGPKGPQ